MSELVIPLTFLIVGYLLGSLNGSKRTVKEFTDETGQVIKIEAKKLFNHKSTIPTGQIKPKSALDIHRNSMNPERREALEDDKRQMDSVPELVAARELAQQMKRGEYGG